MSGRRQIMPCAFGWWGRLVRHGSHRPKAHGHRFFRPNEGCCRHEVETEGGEVECWWGKVADFSPPARNEVTEGRNVMTAAAEVRTVGKAHVAPNYGAEGG